MQRDAPDTRDMLKLLSVFTYLPLVESEELSTNDKHTEKENKSSRTKKRRYENSQECIPRMLLKKLIAFACMLATQCEIFGFEQKGVTPDDKDIQMYPLLGKQSIQ